LSYTPQIQLRLEFRVVEVRCLMNPLSTVFSHR